MAKLKRPFDPIQQEYVERELQKLQAEQEMLRSAKGMGGPTDKMPTTGGSGQFGPAEFKYGGDKQSAKAKADSMSIAAIMDVYKGKEDALLQTMLLSKDPSYGIALSNLFDPKNASYKLPIEQEKRLDVRHYKYGGKKRKYEGGGNKVPSSFYAPQGLIGVNYQDDYYNSSDYLKSMDPELFKNRDYTYPVYNLNGEGVEWFGDSNRLDELRKQKKTDLFGDHVTTLNIPVLPPSYNNSSNNKSLPEIKAPAIGNSGEPVTPKQKFDWDEAGVLGAQLAGDIVGLGYSLKKPNYAKYQRISPSLVNYNQAATDITNQAGLMEQSTAQALRNQGQSSGAYLNNRINLASRLGQQTGAQLAELRMNEANTNVGIKNDAITRNADIQRAEVETNAKEKDSRMQALVTHLGSIGAKVAGYSKDGKQMKMDKYKFDEAMRLYPSLFRGSKITQDKEGNYIITAN